MNRLIGSETEYGLYVEGRDPSVLVEESRALIQAYAGPALGSWDESAEDPRQDLRGFRVDQLAQNPADAQFDRPGAPRLAPRDERSDRVLVNGARLYNDHGHPEYSTPECRSLKDLVAHEKAGERIVWQCAMARSEELSGRAIRIYKNNTDYHGFSYGSHENYLFPRDFPAERLIAGMLPFLVSRPILAGAGKMGIEESDGRIEPGIFQLSQRADFFTVEAGVDTLHRRPIFNTRDEAHADKTRFRRLHVIAGDSNLCEWALALKVGTTHLVLRLLEEGWDPPVAISRPVEAIQSISRDLSFRHLVELADGRRMTAIDIQRVYLDAAVQRLGDLDEEERWVLDQWAWVLNQLSAIGDSCRAATCPDPPCGRGPGGGAGRDGPPGSGGAQVPALQAARNSPLTTRLDWAAKLSLLASYVEAEKVAWDDPMLQSLDLEYHNISPTEGLFRGLEEAGRVRRLAAEEEIQAATLRAPQDTRAAIRGLCVLRWPGLTEAVRWGCVHLRVDGRRVAVDLGSAVDGSVGGCVPALNSAKELNAFLEALRPVDSGQRPAISDQPEGPG